MSALESCSRCPVKLVNQDAQLPKQGSPGAAGYDLYACRDVVIKKKSRSLVAIGIILAIPGGCYGRVAPRSSLAVKGIDVGAGVIDSDYRGELMVLLINTTDQDFSVVKGDRVAQIIFEKIATFRMTPLTNLTVSERGTGGFGSTGR